MMIGMVAQVLGALAVVLLLQWRSLRRASAVSRWISFVLLGASGVVWFFLMQHLHVSRPAVWLEQLLEPFDPIQ